MGSQPAGCPDNNLGSAQPGRTERERPAPLASSPPSLPSGELAPLHNPLVAKSFGQEKSEFVNSPRPPPPAPCSRVVCLAKSTRCEKIEKPLGKRPSDF